MKRLRILTLITIVLSLVVYKVKHQVPETFAKGDGLIVPVEWLKNTGQPITPPADRRPPDQTFLTFPEWFLVFSPEEQAHYFSAHTATSFPFMKHTSQIWESYHIVNNQIEGNFPPNPGYHFMIKVIGTSATVEYAVKAWYETILGRLTDTEIPTTDEDRFNAGFTQRYVDFIKLLPWYEFDFKNELGVLWKDVPKTGDHMLRKWERRYILTSELLIKWGYGKLIKLGTKSIYEEALLKTVVVVNKPDMEIDSSMLVSALDSDRVVLSLPRYDEFNFAVQNLVKHEAKFLEIAGNTSAILITLLVTSDSPEEITGSRTIFVQPITSQTKLKRIALVIPVKELHSFLKRCDSGHLTVEHIFDF